MECEFFKRYQIKQETRVFVVYRRATRHWIDFFPDFSIKAKYLENCDFFSLMAPAEAGAVRRKLKNLFLIGFVNFYVLLEPQDQF